MKHRRATQSEGHKNEEQRQHGLASGGSGDILGEEQRQHGLASGGAGDILGEEQNSVENKRMS